MSQLHRGREVTAWLACLIVMIAIDGWAASHGYVVGAMAAALDCAIAVACAHSSAKKP